MSYRNTDPAGGDLSGSLPNPKVTGIDGYVVPTPSGTNTALTYNGGYLSWQPLTSGFTAAGDLSGDASSQTVIGIHGKLVPTPSGTNKVLKYDGTSISWSAGDELNLLDFGADPTGVADSSTALQSALTMLQLTGAMSLRIPGGTYLIKSMATLYNANGVIIRGDGRGQTILVGGPGTAGQRGIVELKSCYACSIRDMQFLPWGTSVALTAAYTPGSTTITAPAGLPSGTTWICNWDSSCGDIVNITGGNYTLSAGIPDPYAIGDLLYCSSQSAISIYVDIAALPSPTIPSSKNQIVNIGVGNSNSPYAVLISCAGGYGSSSDLDNELHVLDHCELYGGLASLKIVGANPLWIECNNTVFYSIVGIDATEGGSCNMVDCSFHSTDYDIVIGQIGDHVWKSQGHQNEGSGGILRVVGSAVDTFIAFNQMDCLSDLGIRTIGTSTTNSITATYLQGLRVGRQVTLTADSGLFGELATISAITPGTATSHPVITFSSNLVNTYPVNSVIQISSIDAEGDYFRIMIDNSKWLGYGGNAGAWIKAVDIGTYAANFSHINMSNSETSIMGWLLNGVMIHTTDSVLSMPLPCNYSGFTTAMQTYLNGAQWYSTNTTSLGEPLVVLAGTIPATPLAMSGEVTGTTAASVVTMGGDLTGTASNAKVAGISAATGNFYWAASAPQAIISQATQPTDTIPVNIEILAQSAHPGAVTNQNGGSTIIWGGSSENGNSGSALYIGGGTQSANNSRCAWSVDLLALQQTSTPGVVFQIDLNAQYLSPVNTNVWNLGASGAHFAKAFTNNVYTDPTIASTFGSYPSTVQSDIVPQTLTIQAPGAYPAASNNKTGADLVLAAGTAAGGGTQGSIDLGTPTDSSASAGTITPPANVAGYALIKVNGTPYKLALYNV